MVLSEGKGKVILYRGAEARKGAGTNSGRSGTRNLSGGGEYQDQSGEISGRVQIN